MATVTLHIGGVKTGTSFVQATLSSNRELLAELGVLWPGSSWQDQVRAVNGLRGMPGRSVDEWRQLVGEIDEWSGPEALVSMEFLSLMTEAKVHAALDSLEGHHVRVVLTVRDIGRAIPAQWQESVKNGYSWRYDDYLSGVTAKVRKGNRAARHFWGKQSWPQILRPWTERLAASDVIVVTVPPPGAPRGLLWERFCEATGLPAARFVSPGPVNESLGAASAEVMRAVMAAADQAGEGERTRAVLKHLLANQILAGHRSAEQGIVLPTRLQPWADRHSDRLITGLGSLPVTVVGTLDDLRPQWTAAAARATDAPQETPPGDLLDAAAVGLLALARRLGHRQPAGPAGGERQ